MAMPDFNNEVQKFIQDSMVTELATARALAAARATATTARRVGLAKTVGVAGAKFAASSALGVGITTAAPATVVATGVGANVAHVAAGVGANVAGYSPIMWAAKPWLAAKDVANVAFALEKVYAVMDEDRGIWARKYRCEERYACTCADHRKQAFVIWNQHKKVEFGSGARDATHKDCRAVRNFLVAQKEAKVARTAINATVVGVPFYAIYSAARSIYKRATGTIHQDRAMFAQHLVRDALPVLKLRGETVEIVERGCRRAQALIALMCGELALQAPNTNVANYPKTLAALVHPDGWDTISAALSASLITDAGNGKALPHAGAA
jgi:hypothetical protein